MKSSFVILLVFFTIIVITGLYCKKEKPYMNNAVITGYDLRACACCGGLMLNFNNNTQSYKGDWYMVSNIPAQLGITDSSVFPVYLQVDWVRDTLACFSNTITITRFTHQ